MAGNLQAPGEATANGVGRLRMLRIERRLHVDVLRVDPEVEGGRRTDSRYPIRIDGSVEGTELQ